MSPMIPASPRSWDLFGYPSLREAGITRMRRTNENFMRQALPINEYQAVMEAAPHQEPQRLEIDHDETLEEAVHEAIAQLDERGQNVITWRYGEQLTYREIGKRIGLSETWTGRIIHRYVEELQEKLMENRTVKSKILKQRTWRDAASRELNAMLEAVHAHSIEDLEQHQRTLVDAIYGDYTEIFDTVIDVGLCALAELIVTEQWRSDEFLNMLTAKQHDYGVDNVLLLGGIGLGVRAVDKTARWLNLEGRSGVAEPAHDALVDMVGYAVIAAMVRNGTFTTPI